MKHWEAIAPYESHFARSLNSVAEDLECYAALLGRWQAVQNLVSRETLPNIWERHFADSLAVLPLLNSEERALLDIGSGGGFPALVLAIALNGSDRQFTLVEPVGRKVSFLRTVARELSLPVSVVNGRAEEFDSRETTKPDVITSRALAPLPQLCSWMAPLFGPSTRAILHKGREHVEEIANSSTLWHMDVVVTPNNTDSDGVLLTITNLRARSER